MLRKSIRNHYKYNIITNYNNNNNNTSLVRLIVPVSTTATTKRNFEKKYNSVLPLHHQHDDYILNTLLWNEYNNNDATVRFLSILKSNQQQHQCNLQRQYFSTSTLTSATNTETNTDTNTDTDTNTNTTTTTTTTSNNIDKTTNNNNNNKKSHRLSHHYRFHFKESWYVHDDLQDYIQSSFTGSTCHKKASQQIQKQQSQQSQQQLHTNDKTTDSGNINTTNNTNTVNTTNTTNNFDITILGSGSGSCFFERNFSCTALRIIGNNNNNNTKLMYLIDSGENVVNQFIRSTWDITTLQKIFITHLHGDHVMGLPGLITFLERYEYDKYYTTTTNNNNNNNNIINNNEKKKQQRRVLEIYGPVGIYNFIAMNLTYNHTIITFLDILVYELYGGSKLSSKYDICTKQFPEWKVSNVRRKRLLPNFKPTTATATAITTTKNKPEEAAAAEDSNSMSSSSSENDSSGITTSTSSDTNTNHIIWKLCEQNIVESDNDNDNTTKTNDEITLMKQTMYVTAAEVNHVPTMQCFGFVFELIDSTTTTTTKSKSIPITSTIDTTGSIPTATISNIDDKAMMEVKNETYNDDSLSSTINSRFSNDNNPLFDHQDIVLSNDNIMATTTTQQYRKVSFIGDCCYVPPSMRHIINNSNVLIHEATLSARTTTTTINDDTTKYYNNNNNNNNINKNGKGNKYKGHSSAQTAASVANDCIPQILLLNHLNSTASRQSIGQRIVQDATDVISNNTITRVQLSYDFLQLSIPSTKYSFLKETNETK